MIRKVCDLCGKAFPLHEGYTLEVYDNKKIDREENITIFRENNAMEAYDVCEECRQALAQFMGGRHGEDAD